jgi:apolipoprotein N-acyltransferase
MRFPKWTALAAGGLSALGFAPLGWWPLTLGCFALLMHLVWTAPGWRAAAARGYWFGAGHFTVGLNWIAGSFQYQDNMPHWLGWFAVVALALYLAVYPAICAGLAHAVTPAQAGVTGNSLSFAIIFAAFWIITEWLRATVFTGFAWNPLAVALVPQPWLAGIAALIGTYGLSAIAILLAGLIWLVVQRQFGKAFWLAAISGGAALASIFANPSGHTDTNLAGKARLIRVVQPNIGQQDKHKEAYDVVNFAKLAGLTGKPGAEPRLILWPEAAVPDYLGEGDAEALAARQKLVSLIGPKDVLLTGAVKLETREVRRGAYIESTVIGARNSLFALTPDAKIVARYDKSHLVPYGEYLPMQSVLSAIGLSRLVPGTVDFWPGPGARTVAIPGFGKMGVQICYEIIFSGQVVDPANRPDFLFNPSNDAWFGSWGPPQHLAQARLRAIEEAIPIIRATPTGISAVIDANGSVLRQLPYRQAGFIEARLPTPHQPTLFARYGNLLSLGFAVLLGALGIALGRFRR